MKNQELQDLIFHVIREQHSGQVNLASEASAICLADSISNAICRKFHIAKRRQTSQSDDKAQTIAEQLDLF